MVVVWMVVEVTLHYLLAQARWPFLPTLVVQHSAWDGELRMLLSFSNTVSSSACADMAGELGMCFVSTHFSC